MAYSLDAGTDQILGPSETNPTTVTVAFFYTPDAAPSASGTYTKVFTWGDGTVEGGLSWDHDAGYDGAWYFLDDAFSYPLISYASSFSGGTRYHLGFTLDEVSLDCKIYYNGSQDASDTFTNGIATTATSRFAIGDPNGLSQAGEPGDVAEAAVWDETLNADEFAALADGVSPLLIRPYALLYYLPLIRDAHDRIGGTDWSVTGTSIAAHPPVFYPRKKFHFIGGGGGGGGGGSTAKFLPLLGCGV